MTLVHNMFRISELIDGILKSYEEGVISAKNNAQKNVQEM